MQIIKGAEKTFTTDELVGFVRAYALDPVNYEAGWDVVAETFTADEIRERIGGARTQMGALRKFSLDVELWVERNSAARDW